MEVWLFLQASVIVGQSLGMDRKYSLEKRWPETIKDPGLRRRKAYFFFRIAGPLFLFYYSAEFTHKPKQLICESIDMLTVHELIYLENEGIKYTRTLQKCAYVIQSHLSFSHSKAMFCYQSHSTGILCKIS